MRSALPSAARLEILTMRPKRAARMAGSSACTQRMAAATLTAITACRAALVTASMVAGRTIPALFTRRVTGRSATVRARAARSARSSARSTGTKVSRAPPAPRGGGGKECWGGARRARWDDVVVDHLQAVGHQARRHGATDATAGAGHEHGAFLGVVGSALRG